ncbi:isopentenyl-diphosphate Delta-isomerase [Nocardia alba]|uniref:Isopentenyl-diphosphate Delta-isomerase n=1 Tax=Nocardia alba TaxID=225051 RepID=A0A4R1FIN1_9NOCA|nr:isopentenyl-diphosphate Delta-isomerase [Nocardia alba]TCJ93114.1 isopentenyl-diphosphate delta-isomerase [Nocardia alba]
MTEKLADPSTDRETLLVELVDESGVAIGACSVADAHRPPGTLHRAFSVLLFDSHGQVLLQQRAAVKTRFPLQWANTCCGHPLPGQSVVEAAAIRLGEEFGMTADLAEVGVFTYLAGDDTTGRVEYEYDHVLIGVVEDGPPRPDPAEIAHWAWIAPQQVRDDLVGNPGKYTPWLTQVLEIADQAHRR